MRHGPPPPQQRGMVLSPQRWRPRHHPRHRSSPSHLGCYPEKRNPMAETRAHERATEVSVVCPTTAAGWENPLVPTTRSPGGCRPEGRWGGPTPAQGPESYAFLDAASCGCTGNVSTTDPNCRVDLNTGGSWANWVAFAAANPTTGSETRCRSSSLMSRRAIPSPCTRCRSASSDRYRRWEGPSPPTVGTPGRPVAARRESSEGALVNGRHVGSRSRVAPRMHDRFRETAERSHTADLACPLRSRCATPAHRPAGRWSRSESQVGSPSDEC
jgi:hypothetical protein